jgi:hypothetical protein
MILQLALLLLVVVAVFWVSVERPREVLLSAIFLAPWSGLDVDVGVRLTAYRIVMATLAVASVLRLTLRPDSRSRVPVSVLFAALCLYAVIWSLVQIPFLPPRDVEGGVLRAPAARAIIQVFMFGLDVSPVIVVPLVLRHANDVWQAGETYIVSCVVLAMLGWLQIASWYGSGWNPFPIGVVDSLFGAGARLGSQIGLREGIEFHRGVPLYRMNSLGGEPRDLAGSFAIALILLQVIMVNSRANRGGPHLVIWSFLFLSMLLTLSTSGLVLWILGTLALGGLQWSFGSGRSRKTGLARWVFTSVGLPGLAIAATVTLLSSMAILPDGRWLEIAKVRTIGRSFSEDFDAAVIGFLRDQPGYSLAGVGLGNIHLYANDYLPDYADYAVNTSFVAKSGYLRLLSEIGIVGLVLFLAWVAAQIRMLVKVSRIVRHDTIFEDASPLAFALAQFATIICFFYLTRGNYVAPQTFLTFGVVVAFCGHMLRSRRDHLFTAVPTSRVSAMDDRVAPQQRGLG